MKEQITTKQITKNVTMSVVVQAISLVVSLVLNLIVPKYVDEYQYAYWQTYLLYISYVGILHFGLLDGIVLRYSQYDYDELDKGKLRAQFLVLLITDSIISLLIILFSSLLFNGVTYSIIVFVSLGIITRNIFTYTSYSFQITNRISKYASLIVTQRLFYGIGICLLIFAGITDFKYLCVVDLCADLFGILVGSQFNKGLYFGKLAKIEKVFAETKSNISAGALLLLANWASSLLVGSGKMIINWRWNELVFGKVSFAFSVSNLFLNFVTAISVVLFPSLKRMDSKELPDVYKKIRNAISPLLFFVLIFYFPGCKLLSIWLPKYSESLTYLGILLPIIIFASKVSLLTNNYLKAYRKEKQMFMINLLSIAIGFSSYLFCAYVLNSLELVLIAVVADIMLRAILSEIIVMKTIHLNFTKEIIVEAIITIIFMACAYYLNLWLGCIVYSGVFVVYLIYNRNNLKPTLLKMRGIIK